MAHKPTTDALALLAEARAKIAIAAGLLDESQHWGAASDLYGNGFSVIRHLDRTVTRINQEADHR